MREPLPEAEQGHQAGDSHRHPANAPASARGQHLPRQFQHPSNALQQVQLLQYYRCNNPPPESRSHTPIRPDSHSKRPLIAVCNAVQIPLQPGHCENRPGAIAVRRVRLCGGHAPRRAAPLPASADNHADPLPGRRSHAQMQRPHQHRCPPEPAAHPRRITRRGPFPTAESPRPASPGPTGTG